MQTTPPNIKIEQYLLIFIFILSITSPLLLFLAHHDAVYSKAEKRYLHPFADVLQQQSLTRMTKAFDLYFQDHFGLRNWMIHRYQREMDKRFGKTGVASVLKGENNWLFFALDNLPEDFKGKAQFSPDEQGYFWKELSRRKQWHADHGSSYMLLIAPNKQSIYPEFLPKDLQPQSAPTRLDKLLESRPNSAENTLIDVRPLLLAEKKQHRLYDITDTHWNYRGALIGYQAIQQLAGKLFPDYQGRSTFHFGEGWDYLPGGDLALMSGRSATTTEARPILVKDHFTARKQLIAQPLQALLSLPELQPEYYHNPQGQLRVLILHDSFFNPLKSFVSEGFGETLFIWTHYNDATLYFFSASRMARLLEIYQPDLVIEEIVERHLEQFLYPLTGSEE